MKPQAVPAYERTPGSNIDWLSVQGQDFCSTTFFQYKSVLRHAGILGPHPLGAASVRVYDPARDMWQLGVEMLA